MSPPAVGACCCPPIILDVDYDINLCSSLALVDLHSRVCDGLHLPRQSNGGGSHRFGTHSDKPPNAAAGRASTSVPCSCVPSTNKSPRPTAAIRHDAGPDSKRTMSSSLADRWTDRLSRLLDWAGQRPRAGQRGGCSLADKHLCVEIEQEFVEEREQERLHVVGGHVELPGLPRVHVDFLQRRLRSGGRSAGQASGLAREPLWAPGAVGSVVPCN